eukprot:gene12100-biopygen13991
MALQPLQPPRRLRGVALHSPPMRLGAGGRQQCSHESMIDRPIVRKCAPRFPQGETVDGETPSSDGEGTGRGWWGGPVRAPAAYVTGPLTSPENPPGFNCRPVSARARTSPPPHRGYPALRLRACSIPLLRVCVSVRASMCVRAHVWRGGGRAAPAARPAEEVGEHEEGYDQIEGVQACRDVALAPSSRTPALKKTASPRVSLGHIRPLPASNQMFDAAQRTGNAPKGGAGECRNPRGTVGVVGPSGSQGVSRRRGHFDGACTALHFAGVVPRDAIFGSVNATDGWERRVVWLSNGCLGNLSNTILSARLAGTNLGQIRAVTKHLDPNIRICWEPATVRPPSGRVRVDQGWGRGAGAAPPLGTQQQSPSSSATSKDTFGMMDTASALPRGGAGRGVRREAAPTLRHRGAVLRSAGQRGGTVLYSPFFNGSGGFPAGSAERGRWAGRKFAGTLQFGARGRIPPPGREWGAGPRELGSTHRTLGRRWAGRAQGGGGGGGGSVFFKNSAVARLFGTLLASSRRDTNRRARTRRART